MTVSSITLLWIILVLLTLLLLFSLYLTVLRLLEKRRLANEKNYIDRTKHLWMDYLFYGGDWDERLIPKGPLETNATEKLLINFLNSVYVEGTRQKIYLFANSYLEGYYKKMLRSPEWSHRMNGLYRTIDFQLVALAEDHLKRWESKKVATVEEDYYLSLLKIMTGQTTALHIIKDDEHQFSEYQNRALLLKLGNRQLQDLVQNYNYLTRPAKLALIDVVGEKNYVAYQEFLMRQLQLEEESEIRIRILKAIEMIGFYKDYSPIVPFLESNYWEERMLAARLIGTFPLDESRGFLLPLLEDPSWWVRSTAARSVAKQKNGTELLLAYKSSTQDRFAVEIIEEQLMRGVFA